MNSMGVKNHLTQSLLSASAGNSPHKVSSYSAALRSSYLRSAPSSLYPDRDLAFYCWGETQHGAGHCIISHCCSPTKKPCCCALILQPSTWSTITRRLLCFSILSNLSKVQERITIVSRTDFDIYCDGWEYPSVAIRSPHHRRIRCEQIIMGFSNEDFPCKEEEASK